MACSLPQPEMAWPRRPPPPTWPTRRRCGLPRPSERELARRRSAVLRESLGKSTVELLKFTREDRRVDRLRQERMPESETARLLIRKERSVLDRPSQRIAELGVGEPVVSRSSEYGTSRPAAAAIRSTRCVVASNRSTRCSSRSRRFSGSRSDVASEAASSSSAKKGFPSERVTIDWLTEEGRGASAWAVTSVNSSAALRDPNSIFRPDSERRTPSTNRRMRASLTPSHPHDNWRRA